MHTTTKAKLIILAVALLPFLGLVILLGSSFGSMYHVNHLTHSVLLLILFALALLVCSFAYRVPNDSSTVKILAISLAFYTFSINFLIHFIGTFGFILFDGALFYTTENFGVFLGSLLMLAAFLPNVEKHKALIFKYKFKIFVFWTLVLVSFLSLVLNTTTIVHILDLTSMAVAIITTVIFFILSTLFLFSCEKKNNPLSLSFCLGFSILIASETASLLHKEWNLIWWYSYILFTIGIAIILAGFVFGAQKRFETTFEKISFYSRISTKLSFSIIILSIVPLIFINHYTFTTYQENLTQQVLGDFEILAESKEGQTFLYLESVLDRTVDFSSDGFIKDSVQLIKSSELLGEEGQEVIARATYELNNHLVTNKIVADEYLAGIIIVNPEGRVISATEDSEIGGDVSRDSYFKESLDKPSYSEIKNQTHFGRSNLLVVGSPIKENETGELLGVLLNFFDIRELSNIFHGSSFMHNHETLLSSELERGIEVFLVNREGNIFISSDTQNDKDLDNIIVNTIPVQTCNEKRTGVTQSYVNHEGNKVFGVSRCLPSLGWTLLIEVDSDVLLEPVYELKQLSILIIVFIIALVIFIAIYFSGKLTEPLEALIDVSEKISLGNLKVRASVENSSEIGVLAQSLNTMVDELEKRQKDRELQELETQNRNDKLTRLNSSLEDTKRATMNILEDLDEEKRRIEEKIKDRTKELEEEKSKLFHVTANMQTGNIFVDENKKVLFINKAAQDILKVQTNNTKDIFLAFKDKFKDVNYEDLLNICSDDAKKKIISEVEANKRIFEIEFSCVTKDGQISGIESVTENGGHYGTFIWIRDITEQKLLERSKSELVAVASHQLRTPLTIARGNIEMLLDGSFGDANDKQKELLHDTEDSVIRLIELVNDMLDITKIEKGDIDLVLSKFNILEPLQVVINNIGDYAKRHDFDITIHDSGGGVEVFADSSRLVQIFQNLIDNAIRYGRAPGKVDIAFNVKHDMLEVSVGDNGIGIPEMEQANLFGRFYRASNAVKFASGGSGLGLFIVKSLVEQMGGQIRFESVENVGTKFFITIPLNEHKK